MRFEENAIRDVDLMSVGAVRTLVMTRLCNGQPGAPFSSSEDSLLTQLLQRATSQGEGLSHAQFNELLLLLNQNRISPDFYRFFFQREPLDTVPVADLLDGITRFRGFAMLAFGNFRYAYQSLRPASYQQIVGALAPYATPTSELVEKFQERPTKALEITRIARDRTWFTGYLAGAKYKAEAKQLAVLLEKGETSDQETLLGIAPSYDAMDLLIKETQQKALDNNEIYLTWDYMDVYVATSMRHKWEFEETFDFIDQVFNAEGVAKLNLRYFDPTQSLCKNRIDKGLTEALMLKRARCTIYLAQESDTMGKDSELAATLAQGKPVIAYVPKVEVDSRVTSLADYPLEFFQQRILTLRAEGLFDDFEIEPELTAADPKCRETLEQFEVALREHRKEHPFTLIAGEETEFKESTPSFATVCRLIAIAEAYSFERRARLLRERHPLAIQVNLDSGVANGVLVVRSADDCAKLLYNLLCNDLSFSIETQDGTTVLVEEITGCPFRVVTENERLSNSFWNFYVESDPRRSVKWGRKL